jgi:hypothetical protein
VRSIGPSQSVQSHQQASTILRRISASVAMFQQDHVDWLVEIKDRLDNLRTGAAAG